IFSYVFRPVEQPGGSKPEVEGPEVNGRVNPTGLTFAPVPVLHGGPPVTGYRVRGRTYVTDVSLLTDESKELLRGLTAVLSVALRFRPHRTHMNIEQALGVVEELKPRRAYFTHISHEVKHEAANQLPPPHVRLAHDGLEVSVEEEC